MTRRPHNTRPTEWQNTTDMPLTITTQKDLEYDLNSQKRTSLNQTNDHLDVQVYEQIRVTNYSL